MIKHRRVQHRPLRGWVGVTQLDARTINTTAVHTKAGSRIGRSVILPAHAAPTRVIPPMVIIVSIAFKAKRVFKVVVVFFFEMHGSGLG